VSVRNKRARNTVYLRAVKMIDPNSGEVVAAFVPAFPCDRSALRARKIATGSEVRAMLSKPRNTRFHRLGHALAAFIAEHIPEFDGNAHDALKRMQRESGVCCEPLEIDLGPLGKVAVNQARSIAFDEMDEAEFAVLFSGICDYIGKKYLGCMPREEVEEAVKMMDGSA